MCSASLPLLEKLTKKCDHILLCLRVADETINPAVLRRLAFHHRECIRHMVLDNMFTSSAILNEMALREEHVEILLRIVPQLKSKGVLNRLAERLCDLKSEKLARAILKNRWASDYAKTMTALARPQ